MIKNDHYKIAYAVLFFIMIIHIYFVIFFTENKIRLSVKFQSNQWKNLISRDFFDGILYVVFNNQNEPCPGDYNELYNYFWPGTQEGIFLEDYSINDSCKIITNKTNNDKRYKLTSIYSTSAGNLNMFKEYLINTPYEYECFSSNNNNTNLSCTCNNKIIDAEEFYFQYPDKNISCENGKGTRRICKIDAIKPYSLFTSHEGNESKKMCVYKEKDFYVLYNKRDECLFGYIRCYINFCIRINKNTNHSCPNYTEINKNIEIEDNKPISSLDVSYNGIKCSKLNNNTIEEGIVLEESELELTNFDYYSFNKFPLCYYDSEEVYEDQKILYKAHSTEYYTKIGLGSKMKQLFVNQTDKDLKTYEGKSYFDKLKATKDQIYVTATTNFQVRKDAYCSQFIYQELSKAYKNAKNISMINVGKIFFFEFFMILCYCYVFYRYICMRSLKVQNENKFYYVKHFLLLTIGFLIINLIPYSMNQNYKNEVKRSLLYLEQVSLFRCFNNDDFTFQSQVVQTKLKNFSILNYQIYETIIKETIATIISILLIITRIMSIKTLLFKLTKSERKINKKVLKRAMTILEEKEKEKQEQLEEEESK